MKALIHWNQQRKCWTVHTYKGCEWGQFILVNGSWSTVLKPDKTTNPRGFVVCERSQVEILQSNEQLPWAIYVKNQLTYDKHRVAFNQLSGLDLAFTPDGAFLRSVNN